MDHFEICIVDTWIDAAGCDNRLLECDFPGGALVSTCSFGVAVQVIFADLCAGRESARGVGGIRRAGAGRYLVRRGGS